MNLKSLQKLRAEWEDGLTPVASHTRDEWTLLVVLRRTVVMRDAKQPYYCHRYFRLGDEWCASVDRSEVCADAAIQWAITGGSQS